jgi:hypothetical protein
MPIGERWGIVRGAGARMCLRPSGGTKLWRMGVWIKVTPRDWDEDVKIGGKGGNRNQI